MNYQIVDMLDNGVVVFLDNILIYSNLVEEHFELLKKVFICLYAYVLHCKLKKCSFFQKTTTFLGFDIILEGIHISDTSMGSLKEWLKLTNMY